MLWEIPVKGEVMATRLLVRGRRIEWGYEEIRSKGRPLSQGLADCGSEGLGCWPRPQCGCISDIVARETGLPAVTGSYSV